MTDKKTSRTDKSNKTEENDDVNGVPGQIIYPDRVVDAERAGDWVAGKTDFLTDEDEKRHAKVEDQGVHRVQPGVDLDQDVDDEDEDEDKT